MDPIRNEDESKPTLVVVPSTPQHQPSRRAPEFEGNRADVTTLEEIPMTYIRRYNIKAKPFKWTYRSAERRINPVSGLNATPHETLKS
jgi:hypothetical protein